LTIAFSGLMQALKLSYNERTIDRSLTENSSITVDVKKRIAALLYASHDHFRLVLRKNLLLKKGSFKKYSM